MCPSVVTRWNTSPGTTASHWKMGAIRFSLKDMPQDQFVVFALIMDIVLRNKPDWLKASSAGTSVKDKGFGNTLYKVLLESLIPIFAPKPAVLRRQFRELALVCLARFAPRGHWGQGCFFPYCDEISLGTDCHGQYPCQSRNSNGKHSCESDANQHQRTPDRTLEYFAFEVLNPVACPYGHSLLFFLDVPRALSQVTKNKQWDTNDKLYNFQGQPLKKLLPSH